MNKHPIYCILVLQNYLTLLYPKEIIMLIISMMYNNIKVYCGPKCTSFIINGDIYTCDKNNLVPIKQIFKEGKIDSICYGLKHTIFIGKSKKIIYSQGTNQWGQLGLGPGDTKTRDTPQRIMFDFGSKIMSGSCGDYTTIIMTESGEIYGWGHNHCGQLGLGDKIDRYLPHKIPIGDVKSVSCGRNYTIVLTKVGCFGCGGDYTGQLGLGLGKYRTQKSLRKINLYGSYPQLISCGWYHTVVLTNDGIYSWGYNNNGQLALGDNKERNIPQKINSLSSTVTSCIISINCGSFNTMILTEHSELFVCGGYFNPPMCIFQKLNWNEKIQSIHCGHQHTVFITQSEKYYGWVYDEIGQLYLGGDQFKPTEIVIRI